MDIRTISATLAILGTGLTLSACKKANTDATEVPVADRAAAASFLNLQADSARAPCAARMAAR